MKETLLIITTILHDYLSYLFADTKLRKDVIQLILRSHFPCYLTEVEKAGADIEGYEVAGDIVVHAGFYILQ